MSNPKKRGRPTNAELAAKAAEVMRPAAGYAPVMNGDTMHPSPQEVSEEQESARFERIEPIEFTPETVAAVVVSQARADLERAQAYAMRVWSGQAADLKRAERIARCERALIGQNLPTEGVLYPTGGGEEDWTEEDMQPVTWRKAGA